MSCLQVKCDVSDELERSTPTEVFAGLATMAARVVLLATLCLLTLVSGAANAAITHNLTARVTEGMSGAPIAEPALVAVARSSGRIFVSEEGSRAIDVFSAAGAFVSAFGEDLEPTSLAIDESSGDVYVASGSRVIVFRPYGQDGYVPLSEWVGAGTPGGEFGELEGVAVDNSEGPSAGDVYVLDGSDDAVYVYRPKPPGPEEAAEGTFRESLKGGKLEEPNAIAVDAADGRIYVADSAKGVVAMYSATHSFEGTLTGAGTPEGSFKGREDEEGNVRAIAVEAGELFVVESERHVVSEFNATGEWQGWITGTPSGPFLEPDGVAVGPGGGVYVVDAGLAGLGGALDIFGAGVLVPDANTGAAGQIAKTSAVLNGVVNGDGKPAKYRFEWGTGEAYGSSTPVSEAGSGEESVKAEVTGLTAGRAYHFRLVAENENGSNVGVGRQFETRPAVEDLVTGSASGLESTGATVTGALLPHGTDADYSFEWGRSTGYGNSTPTVDAGAGKKSVEAKAQLTGLSPNTSYHYRLSATNSYGTTRGQDETFTTSGPPVVRPQPSTEITHEAANLNASVDPGELETTYRFQYGPTASYGFETSPVELAPGTTFTQVRAELTGLEIGTVYHYRLVAENSVGTTSERDQTLETVPPAPIEGTSATQVSSSEATIEAQIDPLGHDTSVYLQYGTSPCKARPAGCTDIPAPPGTDIGAGETPVPLTQQLTGLEPDTTYHYRVVASNSLGEGEGPERQLTTQPAEARFALADQRAWELVTPPDKHGAPVEALTREGGLVLAAENGDSIAYVANGSVVSEPEGNRSPELQQDIATRTPEGWITQDIATPNGRAYGVNGGNAPEYQFFTPNLETAVVEPYGPEPSLAPGATQRTIYFRDNATDSYQPLVTPANVPAETIFGSKIHFLTATSDLASVILSSQVPLAPAPAAAGLYEWNAGRLSFVSSLSNGEAAHEPQLGFDGDVLAHSVSSDGTRVIWTNREENGGGGHLYLRDTARGETIQLDAAQGVAEPDIGSAHFQTANADGSRVFFTDKQPLTANSTAEPSSPSKSDLYECEIVEEAGVLACHLRDLTVDEYADEHAGVQGLIFGAGEDGSDLYFVAQGVLADNENGNDEVAEADQENLYWLHVEGASWRTTFIAQLSSEDAPEWEGNLDGENTAFLTARVSPNGRYLAFMSNASPTGYDNRDRVSGARDEEVYLYDAMHPSLTCVSCNPTGARPHGVLDTVESGGEGLGLVVDRREVWAKPGHEHWLAGNVPGWTAQSLESALFQSRYLSDEGRLFFDSPDYLVAQAESGKESVYEYEPTGVGSCESPTGGCVSLLSSGSSDRESAFLEATPDGSDVFFLTAAQLSPQDTDTAFDIYDARVCTQAQPCLTPQAPAPPPGCSSVDACRPTEPEQPAPLQSSGSATAIGSDLQPPGTRPQAQGEARGVKTTRAKPSRAQQLARALKGCRKHHKRKKRARCEAQAKRKYGRASKPDKSAKHTRKAGGSR